jgi:hypothetical protein
MKRLFGALIVGTLVFGAVAVSAAYLPMNESVVQAGEDLNVSCQATPITVGYHTFVDGNGDFSVDGIILDGLQESCEGLTVAVSLLAGPPAAPNSGVTIVGFAGGTLPNDLSAGTTASFMSAFPVKAKAIGVVSVLIKTGAL